MTTQTDNGGPAYPWTYMDRDSMGQEVTREQGVGMSLRDYFAAAALHSMDYGWFDSATRIREMAAESYEIADAMLAARKEEA
jgi:hypothetical protein